MLQGKMKGWYKINDKSKEISWDASKKDEAFLHVFKSISFKLWEELQSEDLESLIKELKTKFKFNKYDLMEERIDAAKFVTDLNIIKQRVLISGGKIQASETFRVIMNGINRDFYHNFICASRIKYDNEKEITEDHITELTKQLVMLYETSRVRKKNKLMKFTKNLEQRHCKYCEIHIPKIQRTHNTAD